MLLELNEKRLQLQSIKRLAMRKDRFLEKDCTKKCRWKKISRKTKKKMDWRCQGMDRAKD